VPRARRAVELARVLTGDTDDSAQAEVTTDLRDVLADRAQHQLLEASLPTSPASASTLIAAGGAPPPTVSMEIIGPQSLASIPQVECVSDFTRYLTDNAIREQVIGRFHEEVRPLLEMGASVHIISHSWGTVIAYEALRRLDGDDELLGVVPTLFTVGSALSIPPVKRRLLPEAIDGQRPIKVRRWVNLNARFDIIGGHLRGNPFAVDYEYLNLAAIGCSPIVPNPWCAHSSYFNKDNHAVNKEIFGYFLET
jgi:hypothetical protein